MTYFHVTSSRNRASIESHGLDWSRMGAAPGIAGSRAPEVDGVFLCRDRFEVDWFLTFDNGHGPFDVWSVDGVDGGALLDNGSGHDYLPATIAPSKLTLVERDVECRRPPASENDAAFASSLTITLKDGRVLAGDEAQRRVRGSQEAGD